MSKTESSTTCQARGMSTLAPRLATLDGAKIAILRNKKLGSKTFEKWGLHRALRLAGAKAGDTVRVGALEAELWDYPPKLLEGWDGPAEFSYVEIPSLRRTPDDVLRGWIRERMLHVQRLLLQ